MLKFMKIEFKMKQHEGYLPYYSVLFVVVLAVIKSDLRIEVRDEKIENNSGLHFFMSFIFDQRRWKLRQESHVIATKENDNQLDFGTAF